MKIWFIRHNHESLGPYSLDELKTLSVTQDDYVWKEGFTDWQQVKSVTELNELSAPTPPPFTNNSNTGSTGTSSQTETTAWSNYYTTTSRGKIRTRLIWISILVIFSLITYLLYANTHSSVHAGKSPGQLKAELAQTERGNPAAYIKESTAHHKNLIGEMVMRGTLTNSATVAAFKDVVLQADFLSKTKSIVSSEKFVVYEIIQPGQTIDFKKKILVPKAVQDVEITILNASPVYNEQ